MVTHEVSSFVPIETRHGDDCTCPSAGRITLDLVAVTLACPGDRSPQRAGSLTAQIVQVEPQAYPGRVVITWPGSDPKQWQIAVHDADTQQILHTGAISLTVDWGGGKADPDGPIVVDLHLFTDDEGQPLLGERAKPVRDPDGPYRFGTRVFRCHVAEMRTRPHDPSIPTRESVNCGEHSINQYRQHHGIGTAAEEAAGAIEGRTKPAPPT